MSSAGWYPDPGGGPRQRYWSGTQWTSWFFDGATVVADSGQARPPALSGDEAEHLTYARDVFLRRAALAHVVPPRDLAALSRFADSLLAPAVERVPVAAGAAAASPTGPHLAAPPTPTATAAAAPPYPASPPYPAARFPGAAPVPPPTAVPPVPQRPGPLTRWWRRTVHSVSRDLATHGLAYLGVLLLFVGAFGLVAFAFGDVAPDARPLAELGIALAPFLGAAVLLRRGAGVAGRALETAGGLLLPVMVITAFLDGVAFPPDLTGNALVVTVTATTLLLAAAYAGWSLLHRESALRYLVAPLVWLAAGLATMGVGRDIPAGRDVATVTAAQAAAMALAMLASLVWARSRPGTLLSAPTVTSTLPGLVVLVPLSVLTWVAADWPEVPIALTGVTVLVVLELLIGRVRRRTVTVLQPLWWTVVGLSLVPSLGLAPAAVCAAAGFLALLEVEAYDEPSVLPLSLAASGLAVSSLGFWDDAWWAFAAFTALSAWAHVRRVRPASLRGATTVLDLCAGALPLAALAALAMATDPAYLVLGTSVLSLLAAWPATRRGHHALVRDERDRFWMLWWDALVVVAVASLTLVAGTGAARPVDEQWVLVGAAALITLSTAVGPVSRTVRAWPVLALLTTTWLMASSTLSLSAAVQALTIAAAALVVVVASHLVSTLLARWSEPGSLGLAGLLLGTSSVALVAGGLGWPLTGATALATAAWAATAAWTARGRSPVTDLAARVLGGGARYAPAVVAALGLPVTAALVLDSAGLLALDSPWGATVLAVTAVVYAAAARLPIGEVTARALVGWACVLSVASPLLTWTAAPALTGLLALVATVVLLPRRPRAMVWLGWAALAPTVGLALSLLTSVYDATTPDVAVTVTLAGVGSVMLVGAAAADLRGRSWQPVPRPTHPPLRPVAALGAGEAVVALTVGLLLLDPATAGWVTAGVAVAVVVTGALARAWSLVGLAAALGWLAALQLRGEDLLHAPWVSILVTLAVLAAAELAHRLVRDPRWWVRADWPLAALAHLTALAALLGAGSGDSFALTYAAVGLLCVLAAARLRSTAGVAASYAVIGALLVLVAAVSAGPGWTALALAVASLASSVLALRGPTTAKPVLLAVGAVFAVASWLAVVDWLGWTSRDAVDRTVAVAALLALAGACLLRWTRVDRMVLMVDGAVAVGVATVAPFVPLTLGFTAAEPYGPTVWSSVALAVLAASAGLAARPLSRQWLRYAAPGLLLAAVTEWSVVVDATQASLLAVLGTVTLLCAVALVLPVAWSAWRGPVRALGAMTAVAGIVVAAVPAYDATLVVAALLLAAVLSTAVAVDARWLVAQLLSPVLVCAAWLAYAASSLDGNPQWSLVPIGLTVLVVVELLRRRMRLAGRDPSGMEVVLLEWAGVVCLVGASFVQAFTESLAYAALAAVLGLLVALWGVATRVRRRLTAGVVIVVAALLVLVAVPVAQLLPAWSSVALWVTIAGLGLLAILAATLLEKGRAAVRSGLTSFRSLTQGWE